ncbi:hypothetical protein DYI95_008470 [Thermaerobacter sp. PB12/4term]|uniref:hypothetical protein n=1 Tax=Thermaerobacter sp. PB12/4term TaxID=2293838 RepID=UPI000E325327|nr:hypothetical protein [Thermaerobacter sp. PB12/4term]QIA27549.1 hypothetical protein DYI95_008470 [Thermaerobacter sp. PB12/4term]
MPQGSRNAVTEAVDSCVVYWVAAGLPRPQIDQMAAELRTHLEQAAAAGKSVEAVIGDDVARFAEEWLKAVGRHRPGWERLLAAAQIVAAAVFITLLPAAWLQPVVAIEAAHLVQVLWVTAGVWVLLSPRLGARWLANSADGRQGRLWVAVLALTFVGLLLSNPAWPWVPERILYEVPRWQALVVMAACVAANVLAMLRDPTRPQRPATPS